MSSTYRILCLSHDPAIVIDEGLEFHSDVGGRERAVDAVLNGVKGHEGCDLLIGRYSYPLVEVGCAKGAGCHHSGTRWINSEWLRLLHAVGEAHADERLKKAYAKAQRLHGCWTDQRLDRLRLELGVEEPA
jgi:hypothetical protein